MNIRTYRAIALVCGGILLALSPADISAQPSPMSSDDLQVDAVRTALVQIGYTVDDTVRASDKHVQVVEAHSASSSETVRAFAFADAAAAAAAHRQALALSDGLASNDDVGPQLLSGYGASAWRRNVALVQSSPETFGLLMPPEIDCLIGVSTVTDVPFRNYRVNPVVVQAIQSLQ